MREKKAGFTLIELLVVISIIALLLAILMPALSRAKELAKRVVCGNDLKQVGVAVSGYGGKFDGDLPNILDKDGDEEFHPYVCYRNDKQEHKWPDGSLVAYRFACLYVGRMMDNPKMFYCPSNRIDERKYESYIKPAPWGTLPQDWNTNNGANDWVRAGYEWFPIPRDPVLEEFNIDDAPRAPKHLCRRLEKLNQLVPYATDVMRTRDTFSHKYGKVLGLNALWPDGHVAFVDNQNIFRHKMWDRNPSGAETYEITSYYNQRILTLGAGYPVVFKD